MLIDWEKKETQGGFSYSAEEVGDYSIRQSAGQEDVFFVHGDEDWDPMGPFRDFKSAEDVVIRICICLINYEASLWKLLAAQSMAGLKHTTETIQ